MNKYDVIIFDGNNTAHKSYHVYKDLYIQIDGETINTGMTYGFLIMLANVYSMFAGDETRIYIVWDSENSADSNKEINKDYKSNRSPKDGQELVDRIKFNLLIKQTIAVLSTLNIMQFRKQKVEADDIIATLAAKLEKRGKSVLIVTEDKDYRQLITDTTHLYGITYKVIWDKKTFSEKTGLVKPTHFVDYLAICGDSSDGYYGVPTFGNVKAMQLLTDSKFVGYDSIVQVVLDNPKILDDFDGWVDKVKEQFIEQLSSLNECYQLAKLDTDIKTVEIVVKRHYADLKDFKSIIHLYRMLSIEKNISVYERIFNATRYWGTICNS